MRICAAARVAIIFSAVWGIDRARGQVLVTGSSMAMQSNASATLSTDGYVGTYLVVPAGGATVNFDINATEGTLGSVAPQLNFSLTNTNIGFTINSTSAANYDTSNLTLPAGTYQVSLQRDYAGNTASSAPFTVNSLGVNTLSGSTATFSNVNTDASGNALAAANTYINNYRQGSATVALSGPNNIPLLAGTPVTVKMGRNQFNFGTNIPGNSQTDINTYLKTSPTAGSTADNFQQFINTYFDAVVPSNVGKWSEDEATQNSLTLGAVDTVTAYAKSHQMMARMHNVIWGSQQPTFVNTLLTNAQSTNPTTAAAAKASLNTAITNRIGYYVGGGDSAAANFPNNQKNTVTGDIRAQDYSQIDVLNEPINTPPYAKILGTSGVANVYAQVKAAVASAGANTKLYTNEYNVLQNAPDAYANFYKQYIESLNNAGDGQVVSGIGVEYYPTGQGPAPSSSTIEAAIQNLSVEGLPISITEYGQQSTLPASQAPTVLDNALRLMYGNPNVNTFMIWGWWNGATDSMGSSSVLVNTDWKTSTGAWDLTAAGQTFVADMTAWTTPTQTVNVGSNGTINFNGFYGDYYLGGEPTGTEDANVIPYDLAFNQGINAYNTTVNKPENWFFWQANNSGTWGTGSNWTDSTQGGGTPTTAGYTAYFGSSATNYNLATGAAATANITAPTINVTIRSAVTLGMIVFDNAATSYTLSGSTISLQGYSNSNGNVAAIYVNSGNHSISAPLQFLSNTTVTVAAANSTLTLSNLQSTTATLTKAGAGTLDVNAVNAAGLAINAGTLKIISNGTSTGASVVSALSVAANSTLDLTNNSIGVNYTGASPAAVLAADIASAYDSGKWDLPGITSSTAANSLAYAVGIYDTGSQVNIAYTLVGDANLDGLVNTSDLGLIQPGGTTWSQGDFNYNGVVNADDYALFMLGAEDSTILGRVVPEPVGSVLFTSLAMIALRRTKVRRF
jgi:endo-1,4-beta-xylanase